MILFVGKNILLSLFFQCFGEGDIKGLLLETDFSDTVENGKVLVVFWVVFLSRSEKYSSTALLVSSKRKLYQKAGNLNVSVFSVSKKSFCFLFFYFKSLSLSLTLSSKGAGRLTGIHQCQQSQSSLPCSMP